MKPTLIIDCSLTMAWCFADEGTEETAKIQDRLVTEAVIVPAHWSLEVANVLAWLKSGNGFQPPTQRNSCKLLAALDIQVDERASARAFDACLALEPQPCTYQL